MSELLKVFMTEVTGTLELKRRLAVCDGISKFTELTKVRQTVQKSETPAGTKKLPRECF